MAIGEGIGKAVRALGATMNTELIKYPSGRYGFVGHVPKELSYKRHDGQPLTDDDVKTIRSFGIGMLKHKFGGVSFDSPEEAIAAAKKIGAVVHNEHEFTSAAAAPKHEPPAVAAGPAAPAAKPRAVATLANQAQPKSFQTGAKGGQFYTLPSGRKVYKHGG